MYDSMQMQLFNELYPNTNGANSIREQMSQNQRQYNEMMRTMNYNNLLQNQKLNALTGMYNNPELRGVVGNFAQSQMQGVYSGFGISPEMQNVFSQRVMPTMQNSGAALHNSMTLPLAYFNARYTSAPSALSYEQRQNLAGSLAYGVTNVGTSAASGVGGIGLGIAGLAALAAPISIPAAIGVGLVGWGAKKALTSPLVSSLTGWGNLNPNIFSPMTHIREELAETRDLHSYLTNESYRFMSMSSGRTAMGQGLSRREVQDWTKQIRSFDTKFGMSDTEVQGLMKSAIANETISNVRDFDDFEKKFSKQVQYIKSASKILNKSYQEVSDMMGEFKRAGISLDNFDMKAAELKNYASILGKNIEAVKTFMLESTKLYTQGTGLNPTVTASQNLFSAGIMNQVYQNGNQHTRDIINNYGGPTGATSVVRSAMETMFNDATAKGAFVQFFTPNTTGGFTFNNGALAQAMSAVGNGQSFYDLLNNGTNYLSNNLSLPQQRMWMQSAAENMLNLDESSVSKLMTVLTKSLRNTPEFTGSTDSEMFQSLFRMNTSQADLMTSWLDQYRATGPAMALQTKTAGLLASGLSYRELIAQQRNRGWYDVSTKWLDDIATKTGTNTMDRIENTLTDVMNRRAGISKYDLEKFTIRDFNLPATSEAIYDSAANNTMSTYLLSRNTYSNLRAAGLSGNVTVNAGDYAIRGANLLDVYSDAFPGKRYLQTYASMPASPLYGLRGFIGSPTGNQTYSRAEYNRMLAAEQGAMGSAMKGFMQDYIGNRRYYTTRTYESSSALDLITPTTGPNLGGLESVFQTASSSTGVNTAVLKAIAQVESNFNVNAFSGSSYGLMQINKAAHGDFFAGGADPYNPSANVMYGSKMFAGLLDKFGGNVGMAAMAYNAGFTGTTNAMSLAGYNYSSMTKEQLNKLNPALFKNYLPDNADADYYAKVLNAMNGMGLNGDAVRNTATRTQTVTETLLSATTASNIKEMINSGAIKSNSRLAADLSDAGWVVRTIKERTSPTSIDIDSIVNSRDKLSNLANDLRSKGFNKATASVTRASSYLNTMTLMSAGDLNDVDIDQEIKNLDSTLKEFGGVIGKTAKGYIEQTIKVLQAHKGSMTTTTQTIANTDLISQGNAVFTGARTLIKALPFNLDTASENRNNLLGYWNTFSATYQGILKSPLETVSSSQLIELNNAARDIQKASSGIVGTDKVSKQYRTYSAGVPQLVRDVFRQKDQAMRRQAGAAADGASSPSGYDYNNIRNELKQIQQDKEAALNARDANGYDILQQKEMDLVGQVSQQSKHQEALFSGRVFNRLKHAGLDSKISAIDTKMINEAAKSHGARQSEINKLQRQKDSLLALKELSLTGKPETLEGLRESDILAAVGLLPKSLQGPLGNDIRAFYSNHRVGDSTTATKTPTSSLMSVINDKGHDQVATLFSNGKFTGEFNTIMKRLENGTFNNTDYMNLVDASKKAGPQSYIYKDLIESIDKDYFDNSGLHKLRTNKAKSGDVRYTMNKQTGTYDNITKRLTEAQLAEFSSGKNIDALMSGQTIKLSNGQSFNLSAAELVQGSATNLIKGLDTQLQLKKGELSRKFNTDLKFLDPEQRTALMDIMAGADPGDAKKVMNTFFNSTDLTATQKKSATTWFNSKNGYAQYSEQYKATANLKKESDKLKSQVDGETDRMLAMRKTASDSASLAMSFLTQAGAFSTFGSDRGNKNAGKILQNMMGKIDAVGGTQYSSSEKLAEGINKALSDAITASLGKGNSNTKAATEKTKKEMGLAIAGKVDEFMKAIEGIEGNEEVMKKLQEIKSKVKSGKVNNMGEALVALSEANQEVTALAGDNAMLLGKTNTTISNHEKALKKLLGALDKEVSLINIKIGDLSKNGR